jgi:hypothetical protein
MPDPALPPGAAEQPPAAEVASRLQARFEALEAPVPTRDGGVRPPGAAAIEPGTVPRPGARSGDAAAQRQLDDLSRQLVVLREQLDLAFDEVDERVDEAEARATVAESRAAVAEARAMAAEARVDEAIAAIADLEARLLDDGGEADSTNLRSALDRLRNRLDVG